MSTAQVPLVILLLSSALTAQSVHEKKCAEDMQSAIKYRQEAENGDVSAMEKLGFVLSRGGWVDFTGPEFHRCFPNSDAEALEWIRRAAERGHRRAQQEIGDIYYDGRVGVEIDKREAAKWFRLAAAQGDIYSLAYLARMYRTGDGVSQDCAKAVALYTLVAELGDGIGQWRLGKMYADGECVPQDYLLAYFWSNLAAATGDRRPQAVEIREQVAKRMTPERIDEAQRLAREWEPRNWKELQARTELNVL